MNKIWWLAVCLGFYSHSFIAEGFWHLESLMTLLPSIVAGLVWSDVYNRYVSDAAFSYGGKYGPPFFESRLH